MKQLKMLLRLLQFTFENAPNLGFWLGIIAWSYSWYGSLNVFIRTIIILFGLFGIYSFSRKVYKEIKAKSVDITINSTNKQITTEKRNTISKSLIDAIPTNIEMKLLYKAATEKAKFWASDGTLNGITYYIQNKDGKTTSNAQMHIASTKRNQQLTTYSLYEGESLQEGIEDYLVGTPLPVYRHRKMANRSSGCNRAM